MLKLKRVSFGLVAPTLLCGAVAAPAQVSPSEQQASSGAEIQDIIVTAQKREQSLQKVPLSINVVAGDTLASRNVVDAAHLSAILPSFEFTRAPNGIPGLTYRGIGGNSGNISFDNSIGMFIDGVFIGNVMLYNQTLFDVDHAEMIAGGQGTLLGKNTTIGALSILNKRPGDAFGGHVEAGGEAQNGGYMGDAAINIPVSDAIKLRLSGHYDHDRGSFKNVTTGLQGPVTTNLGARVQALLKPTDRLDFLLSYQHTYNRAIGSSSQISNLGPLAGNGVQGAGNPIGGVTFGTDQRASYSSDPRLHNGDDINSARGDMITGTAHYDLGAATITSITSAAWAKSLAALDFDFDNKDATTVFRYERYNQFTQELRLASNDTSSALQYLAGLYYFQSNFHTVDEYYYGIPDFPPAFLNLGVPPGQLFNGNYDVRFDQHTKSVSGFGQVIWKPIERLTVNVGGRYSHETKHVSIGGDILPGPVTLWNTVVNAPFPYQRLKPVVDNLVSASAALQYQFTGDVMGYAAFSRSGKSGGYGDLDTFGFDGVTFYNGAPAGNPQKQAAIGKERSNSYEIGFKTRLLDRRMTFNAAAFLMDLFGLQQLVFSPAGAFISSNDRVRAKGFEGSIEYQPLPDISMGISATYSDVLNLDTRQRIAQSPRLSGTAHLDYGHDVSNDLRLSVGAAVRHRSSKYNQLGEAEPDGPFTTLGLHARLESRGGWYLNADAENVTNAHGADFGYPGPDPFVGSFKSTAPLRTIWLTAGYKF